MRKTVSLLLLMLLTAANLLAQSAPQERTINYAQFLRLYMEPKKADGTPGSFHTADHPVSWVVDGIPCPIGQMTVIGPAKIQAGGSTIDFHQDQPGGGFRVYQIEVTMDADMDAGEVRDVTGSVQLSLTFLPDEAVTAEITVSAPLSLP